MNRRDRRQLTPRGHDTSVPVESAGIMAMVEFAKMPTPNLAAFIIGTANEADAAGFSDVGCALREAATRLLQGAAVEHFAEEAGGLPIGAEVKWEAA